jgi:hypothetical protein
MAKIHFISYTPNQMVLFPQRIDEDIAENDPVRIINGIIDTPVRDKRHQKNDKKVGNHKNIS